MTATPDETEDLAVRSSFFMRAYPVEDIRILTRAQGAEYADGRTVEALVAVFDRGAEIVDQQGHYVETIGRSAFDKAINDARPQGSRHAWRVGVFYNHGMTLHGTPSDQGSIPLGSPLDIRADAAGLVTVTRYNETPLAEQILETIRAGDIGGHSFTGRIVKSNPVRPPSGGFRMDSRGDLPTVHRMELGLREYGPTPFPAYTDTAVLGVRSFLPTTQHFLDEHEEESEPVDSGTPSDEEAAPDEPPDDGHSSRDPDLKRLAVQQRIAMLRRTRPGLARSEGEQS